MLTWAFGGRIRSIGSFQTSMEHREVWVFPMDQKWPKCRCEPMSQAGNWKDRCHNEHSEYRCIMWVKGTTREAMGVSDWSLKALSTESQLQFSASRIVQNWPVPSQYLLSISSPGDDGNICCGIGRELGWRKEPFPEVAAPTARLGVRGRRLPFS